MTEKAFSVTFAQETERILDNGDMAKDFAVSGPDGKVFAKGTDYSSKDGLTYWFVFRRPSHPSQIDTSVPKEIFDYEEFRKKFESKHEDEFTEDVLYDKYLLPKIIAVAKKHYFKA